MALRLTLLLALCAASVPFAKEIPRDAVFLATDTVEGRVVGVYIDPHRDSPQYRKLTNFELDDFTAGTYRESLENLREHGLKLGKIPRILPWRQWVKLESYQGRFYAYKPCDFLFHYQWSINDSASIEWYGEGPFAGRVTSQRKLDARTYQIRYAGALDSSGAELTIHLVDPAKGIAVFRDVSSVKDTSYRMMVAADKIRSVPLIVNHCPTGKRSEFEFEKIDGKRWMER